MVLRRLGRRRPLKAIGLVVHRSTAAIDIRPGMFGREVVLLADGGAVEVDHVILTSGHTPELTESMARARRIDPYPIQSYVDTLPGGASVGVARHMEPGATRQTS